MKRLPKGFGSIVKLSGNRRKPFMARPAIKEYNDKGKPIAPSPIGYYETYIEAMNALTDYNRCPYDTTQKDTTFAEVFDAMMKESHIANSTAYTYRSMFNGLSVLHDKRIRELRLRDLQEAVDHSDKKGYVGLQIVLIKKTYKYAMKYELVDKDYSAYLTNNGSIDDEKGVPFSEEELAKLKELAEDDETIERILVMIYSGFRILAYETIAIDDDCFKGGVKTKASKDRLVPIHPAIKKWANLVPFSERLFRKAFNEKMKALGMNHTPHDCRHTFSWLCDKYGVEPFTKRMLLGHSLGTDTTDLRYGHRTREQLVTEVLKIEY